MAWRKPTKRDIAAKLTQRELDAFSASPDFMSGADPVSDILELTAETVRGFCRTNRQVKMSPENGTIPEGLMTFAMDMAAFDILKRTALEPNDVRKAAWEKAMELMQSVGKGEYIPESYVSESVGQDETDSNRAMPGFSKVNRRKLLNEYPLI